MSSICNRIGGIGSRVSPSPVSTLGLGILFGFDFGQNSANLKGVDNEPDPVAAADMAVFDALPPMVRRWVSRAAFDYRPEDVRVLVRKMQDAGKTDRQIMARLESGQRALLRNLTNGYYAT